MSHSRPPPARLGWTTTPRRPKHQGNNRQQKTETNTTCNNSDRRAKFPRTSCPCACRTRLPQHPPSPQPGHRVPAPQWPPPAPRPERRRASRKTLSPRNRRGRCCTSGVPSLDPASYRSRRAWAAAQAKPKHGRRRPAGPAPAPQLLLRPLWQRQPTPSLLCFLFCFAHRDSPPGVRRAGRRGATCLVAWAARSAWVLGEGSGRT
mmetsp:Transcript_54894/g.139129  ORF Transcript_54894/g.139129 Transcript_54894/m.139129 type:complete len:205 (+) Transcript_54894:1147-1761(+)